MSEFNNEDLENLVSKDDDETHENIFKNIFSSCDQSKCGFVQVSKIIELVAPFLQHNEEKLQDLKSLLDPQNNNPLITQKLFLKSMREWTEKICDSPDNEHDQNAIQCMSTPARNEHETHRFPDLNISNISNYSSLGGAAVGYDPNILQEQINELEYQIKKLNDQLTEVRNQLMSSEEQNSLLQTDMEKLTKKLQSEQRTNEMYNVLKKEYEEYRENTESILKHYENSNRKNMSLKKENSQLKQNIEALETENHKLVEQMIQLRNKESLDKPKIEELQIELTLKDEEIETLEMNNKDLNDKLREHEKNMQEYIDKIQHLKYENKFLEKRRNDLLKVNSSITSKDLSKNRDSIGNTSNSSYYSAYPGTPFSPPIENKNFQFYNFDSPYTRKNFTPDPEGPSTRTPPQKNLKSIPKSKIPVRKSLDNDKFDRAVTSTPNKSDSDIVCVSPKCKIFRCRSSECVFQKNEPIYHSLNIVPEVTETERLTTSLPNDTVEIVVDKFEYHLEHVVNNEDLTRSSADDAEHFMETQMLTNIFIHTSPHESLMSELNHASINVAQVCCDHGLQLIEKENRIKSLELKLSGHETCSIDSENKKQEITKLQEKMKKVFMELDKVKTELKQSKTENVRILEKNTKYEDMLHRTKSTMLELETRVSKYEIDKTSKYEEIDKLRSKEHELKNEIKNLKSVLDELHKKYSIAKQETEDCKKELRNAQKNQDQFLVKYQQLNKDMLALKEETKKLSDEKEKSEHECNNLREQLKCKKLSDEKFCDEIKKYQFEIQEQEKRLKKMDNLIVVVTDLEQNIDEYKRKYKDACRYQQEAIELKERFDDLGNEYEKKISNLLDEFNEEKDYFKTQINELEQIQTILIDEKQLALNDVDDLNNKIEDLTTESMNLKIKNQNLENNVENLKDEIHRLLSDSTDMRKLETDILDLKNEIQKMTTESINIEKENSDLKNQAKNLSSELTNKKSENHKLESEIIELKNIKHKLSLESTNLRTENHKLKIEYTRLEDDMEALKNQIVNVKQEYEFEITEKDKESSDLKQRIKTLIESSTEMESEIKKLREADNICDRCRELELDLAELRTTRDDDRKIRSERKYSNRPEILNFKLEKMDEQLFEEKEKNRLLKEQISSLKTERSDLETELKKLKDERNSMIIENEQSLNKIKKMTQQIESLEMKWMSCRQTITDLNEKNASSILSQEQLKDMENKLTSITKEYDYFKKHMYEIKNEIFKYRQNLGSQTLMTLNVWQSEILNILPNNVLFNALADNEMGSGDFVHPVDEEMLLFNKQIKLTTSLLNTMNKLKDVKRNSGILNEDPDSNNLKKKEEI